MAYTKAQVEEAREKLREIIKPGDTVYLVLNHVSRSKMMRIITPYIFRCNNGKVEHLWLSYWVARALNRPFNERYEGVRCDGCGMDMGFDLVYSLSCALFCPDEYDADAAYGLKHEWL